MKIWKKTQRINFKTQEQKDTKRICKMRVYGTQEISLRKIEIQLYWKWILHWIMTEREKLKLWVAMMKDTRIAMMVKLK